MVSRNEVYVVNSCAPLRTLLITLSLIVSIATSGCVVESADYCVDENDDNGEEIVEDCPTNSSIVMPDNKNNEDGSPKLMNSSIVMPDVKTINDGDSN